eukprot:2018151-Pyramimonas_sp.AAC.1
MGETATPKRDGDAYSARPRDVQRARVNPVRCGELFYCAVCGRARLRPIISLGPSAAPCASGQRGGSHG